MPSIYKQQQITIGQNNWFALFILLGIVMIIGCILYSYKLFGDKVIERFQDRAVTYADLVPILNNVKLPLEVIRRAQNLEIPYPETPNVSKYIAASDITVDDSINNVNATFDLDFSQQLQNADLQELEAELLELRKKAAEIKPDDPNKLPQTGIKHLSGTKLITYPGSGASASVDLANPNTYRNFNIGVDSASGYCIVNQPYAQTVDANGIRQKDSIAQVQCNLADSTQWFSTKQINSNAELNNLLPVEKQIPAEYTLINYPFSIVQPNNGTGKECLTLNEDGLSVEPCNGSTDQRFAVMTAV
jgi:hypothetical protein